MTQAIDLQQDDGGEGNKPYSSMVLSNHAEQRIRQRGLRHSDITLILDHGTPAGEATVLRNRDVQNVISHLKETMRRLNRLAGVAVIMEQDTIVSVYRPSKSKRRAWMQKARSESVEEAKAIPRAEKM